MKYLVTGATGNIGSGVTRCLVARGDRPRVFVRDAKKARALFGRRVEVVAGDLAGSRASLSAALAGIDAAFLLSSGPWLGVWDRTIALAARAAGVGDFEADRHHWTIGLDEILSSGHRWRLGGNAGAAARGDTSQEACHEPAYEIPGTWPGVPPARHCIVASLAFRS